MHHSSHASLAVAVFRAPPERLNCAQAVMRAFEADGLAPPGAVRDCSGCGGGRVEGNVCGALYAAQQLVKEPVRVQVLQSRFAAVAGSTRCLEIRRSRQLSCEGCVKLAAELVEELALPRPGVPPKAELEAAAG